MALVSRKPLSRLGHGMWKPCPGKTHRSSGNNPRKKTMRVTSRSDSRVLVRILTNLFRRTLEDRQPSQVTLRRAEQWTSSQQHSLLVEHGQVCHVSILESIL